jgi:hypothetical protein
VHALLELSNPGLDQGETGVAIPLELTEQKITDLLHLVLERLDSRRTIAILAKR